MFFCFEDRGLEGPGEVRPLGECTMRNVPVPVVKAGDDHAENHGDEGLLEFLRIEVYTLKCKYV